MNDPLYFDFTSAVVLKEKLRDVSVGEVTTVDPHEAASVVSHSDGERVLLDFALPKGEEGFSTTVAIKTDSLPINNSSVAVTGDCVSVTICDKDGEKTFLVPPSGVYVHPTVSEIVMGNALTLKANTYYCHYPMTVSAGYLKIDFSSENSFKAAVPLLNCLDSWRVLLNTGTPGTGQYIESLHIHKDIRVPLDWIGQQSSQFADYNEYYLSANTIYDITVEAPGALSTKLLSCKTWNG